MEDDTRNKSAFNDSIGYLRRINILLHACNIFSTESKADEWFNAIRALSRELGTEMKPEEKTKIKEQCIQLEPKIKEWIKGYKSKKEMDLEIPLQLYNELQEVEESLRTINKAAGLQQKEKEFDPRMSKKTKT